MTGIWKRLAVTGTIAITALSAVGVSQASAAPIPCAPRTLSKAFAQWNDMNDYFLVSDGTFEAGAPTWGLEKNAAVTRGMQEPWKVNGATHNVGLSIANGSRARAPETCLTVGEEYVRFFYRTPSAKNATLVVTVTSKSNMGTASTAVTLANTVVSAWAVSPPIPIPNVLGERAEQYVDIAFVAIGGTWSIDDVMIDPFKAR